MCDKYAGRALGALCCACPQTDRAAVAAVAAAAATLIISLPGGGGVVVATAQMITFIFSERIPNCANANTSC